MKERERFIYMRIYVRVDGSFKKIRIPASKTGTRIFIFSISNQIILNVPAFSTAFAETSEEYPMAAMP